MRSGDHGGEKLSSVVTVAHALHAADRVLDVLLDLRAGRAPHRRERVDDGDRVALDLHLVDEAEVDDVHAELGILDDPQASKTSSLVRLIREG